MSTDAQPQSPPAATSPSSAPSGGTPTGSEPPSSPPANDFRFGDDAPAWAKGKTPQEVLGIASQLANTVQQYNMGGQPQQQQYQAAPQQPQQPQFASDEYVTGDRLQQWGQQAITEYVTPQLQGIVDMTAQTNLNFVQREFSKEFERYGPEIHANLATLTDKRLWTVDNLKKIVKFVKADHVDELAREQAARLVAEMEPTWRSSGAASAPVASTEPQLTVQSETLPADWRERAAKVGLTEQTLDEFCRANDMTRADWFKLFDKTAITEVTRRG